MIVHLITIYCDGIWGFVCGKSGKYAPKGVTRNYTDDPREVTCEDCIRTKEFRYAVDVYSNRTGFVSLANPIKDRERDILIKKSQLSFTPPITLIEGL